MKKIICIFAFALLMSCDKDEVDFCKNKIINIEKKQDFNAVIYTETIYKNTCTNEIFIVNTY